VVAQQDSRLNAEMASRRLSRRQVLSGRRVKLCAWSLGTALFGLVLAGIDAELVAAVSSGGNELVGIHGAASLALKLLTLASTLLLDVLIVGQHFVEAEVGGGGVGDIWTRGILKKVF